MQNNDFVFAKGEFIFTNSEQLIDNSHDRLNFDPNNMDKNFYCS